MAPPDELVRFDLCGIAAYELFPRFIVLVLRSSPEWEVIQAAPMRYQVVPKSITTARLLTTLPTVHLGDVCVCFFWRVFFGRAPSWSVPPADSGYHLSCWEGPLLTGVQ